MDNVDWEDPKVDRILLEAAELVEKNEAKPGKFFLLDISRNSSTYHRCYFLQLSFLNKYYTYILLY